MNRKQLMRNGSCGEAQADQERQMKTEQKRKTERDIFFRRTKHASVAMQARSLTHARRGPV